MHSQMRIPLVVHRNPLFVSDPYILQLDDD